MTEQLSGTQLFLRYAWPCAEGKLRAKKISQDDFDRLWQAFRDGDKDIAFLLTVCFPKAVEALKNHARTQNLDMWSFEAVSEYWAYCHDGTGDCAVKIAVIRDLATQSPHAEVITKEKEFCIVSNTYRLALKVGDKVLIHQHTIIEVY